MQVIVFLTYKCEMKCSYCLVNRKNKAIRPTKYWIDILGKIEKKYPAQICLTGGNPVLYPGIEELVKLYYTDILCFDIQKSLELARIARNLSISIDSLNGNFLDKWSELKTNASIRFLEKYKDIKGRKSKITVNIVANELNYQEIPSMVIKFTEEYNAYTNINILHTPQPIISTKIIKLADKLIELYRQGYKLDHQIVYETWKRPELYKCIPSNIIGIEPDGSLVLCFFRKGHYITNYTVEDLLNNNKAKVLEAIKKDLSLCPGCKLSSVIVQDQIALGKISMKNWF